MTMPNDFTHHILRTTGVCLIVTCLCLAGCSATQVTTTTASMGTAVTKTAMLQALQQPGRIEFDKHLAGKWQVPLSGLLNLEHPKAQAAGLTDRDEPIELYVYSLRHPDHGTFIVDSGLAETLRDPERNKSISPIVKSAMNTEALVTVQSTAELSDALNGIDGVFLTHLHLDHILGLLDLSGEVPVFVGPGDAQLTSFMNLFTQGTFDRLLANVGELKEWPFATSQILDIFNDGTVFAIRAPGHTPGTTAYLANTTNGLQLMIGDITHTRWGWEQGVEPGTYSHDGKASAESLAYIKGLVRELPTVQVHPGHQSLTP